MANPAAHVNLNQYESREAESPEWMDLACMGIVVLRAGAYTLAIVVDRLRIHGCYTKPSIYSAIR